MTYHQFIFSILITLLPTILFSQTTRTEFNVYYLKKNKKLTKKTETHKVGYEKYDKQGNVIEEGQFGEIRHSQHITKNSDSSVSVTLGHSRNYDNLNAVSYSKYDSNNHLIEEEHWRYINNEKYYLIYKIIYEYSSSGELVKEIKINKNDKILETKNYYTHNNIIISIDTTYSFTHEGISKFNSESRDTTYLDSLKRPREIIHFYQGKFLSRRVYRYDRYKNTKTILRYDDKPDSLWSIMECRYDYYDDKLTRYFYKIIGGSQQREVYEYDKSRRLIKILKYNDDDQLTGYTKYEYE